MVLEGDFYLAHPKGSRHLVRNWELGFEKRTGIQLINPFYDVNRPEIIALDKGEIPEIQPTSDEIVTSDLELVQIAKRGLIAIVDGAPSIGTFHEILYSNKIFKKLETYAIVTDGRHNHPWIVYHTNKIFLDQIMFEKYITNKK